MRSLVPRLHVLSPQQLEIWKRLRPVSDLGFVLYGCGAVAIRLGHRSATGFEFLTDGPLVASDALRALPGLRVLGEANDALSCETEDGVAVSFRGRVKHGRVGEPCACADTGVQVASLDDLMALALNALLERVCIGDYRDIAAMIREGVDVSRGLMSGMLLFGGPSFPIEILKHMIWFAKKEANALGERDRDAVARAVKSVSVLPHVNILSARLAGDSVPR